MDHRFTNIKYEQSDNGDISTSLALTHQKKKKITDTFAI